MEFKQYDLAINKYYSGLQVVKMPLSSWDFYGSAFQNLKQELSDVSLLEALVVQNKWQQNWNFKQEFSDESVIVVTDAKLNIIFASKNMVKMNGYLPEEVIGNSPKLFQGELTNAATSKEIGEAVKSQKPFNKIIMNYCKDGSLYKCHIQGFPIFNKSGELTNFIAFEKIAA